MNIQKLWNKINEEAEDDYYSLTENERAFFNLKNLSDAVNGRGLLSFYENEYANYCEDVIEDLYSSGMDEIAAVLESANSTFPGGVPDEDIEERLEIIDSWDHDYDSLFEQWTDDILEFGTELESAIQDLASEIDE